MGSSRADIPGASPDRILEQSAEPARLPDLLPPIPPVPEILEQLERIVPKLRALSVAMNSTTSDLHAAYAILEARLRALEEKLERIGAELARRKHERGG